MTRQDSSALFARRGITLVLLAVIALTACTTDERSVEQDLGDPTSRTESAGTPEWLFVAQSDGESTFVADSGRLTVPAESVQAFTDRPYRDTKAITPRAFANLFHLDGRNSFEQDPPNAVLTYWEDRDGTPSPRTVVCEARDAGVVDGRLWVDLEVLEPAGVTLPQRLSRASLFVDDLATGGCQRSIAAEDFIDMFNELVADGDVAVSVQDLGDSYQVMLECAPNFPSDPAFVLQMTTGSLPWETVSCNTDVITIRDAWLGSLPSCSETNACSFDLVVRDASNDQLLSDTEAMVPIVPGGGSYSPGQLDPADVPPCSN